MTIVYDKLMALDIAPAEQIYDAKDCMLYALGCRPRPRSDE